MLSIPHMIVVFIVVLVVFGPQKLPELARSFGKLMAEFRKASGDFKSAFEEEMRDLERQARIAELKKQAAEAVAAANTVVDLNGTNSGPAATLASPEGTESLAASQAAEQVTDAPVIVPATDSVARVEAAVSEPAPQTIHHETGHETIQVTAQDDGALATDEKPADPNPSHDQQQPA
jgi:TatA/E family protein of Tat protein translocase